VYVLSLGRLSRPPQIATEPRNATVRQGDDVLMSCLSYSSEPSLTSWLKHHTVNGSYLDAYNRLNFFTRITVSSFLPYYKARYCRRKLSVCPSARLSFCNVDVSWLYRLRHFTQINRSMLQFVTSMCISFIHIYL